LLLTAADPAEGQEKAGSVLTADLIREQRVGAVVGRDVRVDGPLHCPGEIVQFQRIDELGGQHRIRHGRILQVGRQATAGEGAGGDEADVFRRVNGEGAENDRGIRRRFSGRGRSSLRGGGNRRENGENGTGNQATQKHTAFHGGWV